MSKKNKVILKNKKKAKTFMDYNEELKTQKEPFYDEQLIRDIEATIIDSKDFKQTFDDIAELDQAKLALW